MGVDYRNKFSPFPPINPPPRTGLNLTQFPTLQEMATTFQFMRIIPAVAFKINEMITVSAAPHLAWGSLSMSALICDFVDRDGDTIPGLDRCYRAGGGQSQDIGIAFQIGASLNFGDFLFAGVTYQSPVSMKYKKVFDSDGDGVFEDMKLTQPQEVAIGVGAAPLNNLRVGLDLRWINWSDADGYEDLQWKDQLVIAIGGEFKPTDKLALRAGWNYGRSPIRGGEKTLQDFESAAFNLIGFPAIAEHHITLGLGYEFTDTFSVDFSYVRALDKKVEACLQGTNCAVLAGAKMFQDSISVGLNWRF